MIGLIGKKKGMTQIFDDNGTLIPVSVIQILPNTVVSERTQDKNGYDAVVLGAGEVKDKNTTKPYKGQFKDGMVPVKLITEFRDYGHECNVGDTLDVSLFENISFVDIIGTTKGKGYQGVMKRHGFGGGRKTHGSKFHRANGSTGQAAYPSKVMKGTKMPGRMGGVRTTVQNLRIVQVDAENNLMLVRGAVPGRNESFVIVKKAKKK